jgi:hypothetical protein
MVSVLLPQPKDIATAAAEGLSVKLPSDETTVREIVVVAVVLPDVPVMITVELPTVAVEVAVNVSTLVLVVGLVP